MKTKEITGWVYLSDNRFMAGVIPDNFKEMGESVARAKLIIEIPERKIEISESEFCKIIDSYSEGYCVPAVLMHLKQKLFGKT